MLNLIVLRVMFFYCYAECDNAECRCAECRYAECRCADCHDHECRGATVIYKCSQQARALDPLAGLSSSLI
jgi:hypothetical protein